MPRNVAGVYTLPPVINPVVTATTIASSWANPTLSDIATALSDSIDRQGRTTILANLPMGGFKHTGAAIAANANEYVTWNQTGAKFPALGIGVAHKAWAGTSFYAVDVGPRGSLFSDTTGINIGANTYYDGTNYRAKETASGSIVVTADEAMKFYTMASVSADAVQTLVERMRIDSSLVKASVGVQITSTNKLSFSNTADICYINSPISNELAFGTNSTEALRIDSSQNVLTKVSASAPALATNSQMVFTLTSNTNLRISVRGTDGTTRVNNLTLS